MYFRYNKTLKKVHQKVQDNSSYTFRAKKWGEIEQKEREADRNRQTESERQTDRQADRVTNRERSNVTEPVSYPKYSPTFKFLLCQGACARACAN